MIPPSPFRTTVRSTEYSVLYSICYVDKVYVCSLRSMYGRPLCAWHVLLLIIPCGSRFFLLIMLHLFIDLFIYSLVNGVMYSSIGCFTLSIRFYYSVCIYYLCSLLLWGMPILYTYVCTPYILYGVNIRSSRRGRAMTVYKDWKWWFPSLVKVIYNSVRYHRLVSTYLHVDTEY